MPYLSNAFVVPTRLECNIVSSTRLCHRSKKLLLLGILFFGFVLLSHAQVEAVPPAKPQSSAALGALVSTGNTDVFFVANNGNDSWSGTLPTPNTTKTDGPFATLQRARDAVRELKAAQGLKRTVKVLVRGGTYYLTEPLVLEPRDSGTKEHHIVYAAFPKERPVISGGRLLACNWKRYRGKIMVCTIPDVKAGKLYFRQLVVDGKRQPRARLPKQGTYLREKALGPTSFQFRQGDMHVWPNLEDVEVVVFHSWNESRLRIESLDQKKRIVHFRDPKARHVIGWTGAGGPNRYYIENTLDGIHGPGQWCLERKSGKLYYWPSNSLANSQFVVPVLQTLVELHGNIEQDRYIQYVDFRGLTFSDTCWTLPPNGYPDCGDVGDIVEPSAIMFSGTRHCSLRDCRIKNTGTYAVEVTGDDNRIEDNEIYATGGGGVITRSYGKLRNIIAYNHIHDCGLVYPSAVGINIDDGGGTIAHNLIHDISHSGVYARHWATATQPKERRNQQQGLAIEYNEIHDVMLNINDGAGIFIRDSNITINNNLIHDVYGYDNRCPGWGIYLGCETRDTSVTNNVVYNTTESVHVWYHDRNVVLENNIFVGPRKMQIDYQNPPQLSHKNIRFLHNVVYCTDPSSYLFHVSGKRSLPVESDYNLIFSTVGCVLNDRVITGLPKIYSLTDWQKLGLDKHTIAADPLFVDLAHDNYALRPESPAFKVGFKAIDLSTVGLRGRKKKQRTRSQTKVERVGNWMGRVTE